MNVETKSLLLTTGIGLLFASAPTGAAFVEVVNSAVAPAHCQAFTPGTSNTIRNRVAGAENVGAELALACSFENIGTIDGGFSVAVGVRVVNNSAQSMTINCTNLQGFFGAVGSTITKSATLAPGAGQRLAFSAADTPSTTDTDLGSFFSGVNCTMPTNAVMTQTDLSWQDDFAG